LSGASPAPADQEPGASLEALAVGMRFGKLTALTGVSLRVAAGELYGLVGPDGAGKTTLIRLLAGLLAPTSGALRVTGRDPLRDSRQVREVLGYMPQAYSLYGDLSVDENLRFFGSLFALPRDVYRERRARLLGITRLERFADRRADALSGGMYKKLALACALLHRPRVLLLDEPTNGVDPVSRRDLWDLLREFVLEGMSVLISTPYMDEASRCHRIGLLSDGRLLLEGSPERLVADFPHPVFRVDAADRAAAERLLHGRSEVVALSPAGRSLRVVVEAGQVETLAAALAPAGCRLEQVRPDFEDLFLERTRAHGEAR
jgi:ABC-2 type transport system ATP-binding protein